MTMNRTRIGDDGISRREGMIAAEEASIKRLETLKEARNHPVVQILLKSLSNAKKYVQDQLESVAGTGSNPTADQALMYQLGGELKAYKAITNDLGGSEKSIDLARSRIEKHKNIIQKAKANDGLVMS